VWAINVVVVAAQAGASSRVARVAIDRIFMATYLVARGLSRRKGYRAGLHPSSWIRQGMAAPAAPRYLPEKGIPQESPE
jgi:hypothetical protein